MVRGEGEVVKMMMVSFEKKALNDLKDELAKKLFGRSLSESLEKRICVRCGASIKEEDFKDEASKKEYTLSGLCQKCQDEIWEGGLLEEDMDLQNYIIVTRAKEKAISVVLPQEETPSVEMPVWEVLKSFNLIERETFYQKLQEFRQQPLDGVEEIADYLESVEREAGLKEDVYPISYFFERYFKPLTKEKILVALPSNFSWSAGVVLLSEVLRLYEDKIPLVVADLRNRGFEVYYNFDPTMNSPKDQEGYVGVFLFEENPKALMWLGRFYPKPIGGE